MSGARLQEQWQSYAREVLPTTAPPVQVLECRRAFFAGAQALMGVVMGSLSGDAGVTDDDVDVMKDLHLELEQFMADVKGGRA